MDRVRASAIAQIEAALRSTLDDITSRVRNGAGRSTVTELVRHARELARLLDQAVERLDPDGDSQSARRVAGDLHIDLEALERELANRALH
ncbi:MAG TPA: hypothetical protein VLR71_19245 [Casimicrobiaceae bacterium]|nr:hypothetical protein [Casimicrobiaceae bacterium]